MCNLGEMIWWEENMQKIVMKKKLENNKTRKRKHNWLETKERELKKYKIENSQEAFGWWISVFLGVNQLAAISTLHK